MGARNPGVVLDAGRHRLATKGARMIIPSGPVPICHELCLHFMRERPIAGLDYAW